jgi:hypothetical protein
VIETKRSYRVLIMLLHDPYSIDNRLKGYFIVEEPKEARKTSTLTTKQILTRSFSYAPRVLTFFL